MCRPRASDDPSTRAHLRRSATMALTQDQQKEEVAAAALQAVRPYLGAAVVLGIGTGTTAEHFIDLLAASRAEFRGAVASSERSAARLRAHGIAVFDLNDVTHIPAYVDGADEITETLAMLKGGGGALTREKIVASVAERFICIADASKLVRSLGTFPLPVEIIPMARTQVTRQLARMAGTHARLRLRTGADGNPFMTDNGNVIIDIAGLEFADPRRWEKDINALPGVVENGLFAERGADLLLLGGAHGVRTLVAPP